MHINHISVVVYLEASHPVEIISEPYFRIFPDEVFKVCVLPSNATTGSSYSTYSKRTNSVR
jgi:hypothetical protein